MNLLKENLLDFLVKNGAHVSEDTDWAHGRGGSWLKYSHSKIWNNFAAYGKDDSQFYHYIEKWIFVFYKNNLNYSLRKVFYGM